MTMNAIAASAAGLAYRMPEGFLLLSGELSPDGQKAVMNTVVLAYAAADKAQPGDRSLAEWSGVLRETLAKVGWVQRRVGGEIHVSTEVSQTASEVSRELPAPLRESVREAVDAAFASPRSRAGAAQAALEKGAVASGSQVFNVVAGYLEGKDLALSVVQIAASTSVRDSPTGRAVQSLESRVEYRWQAAQAVQNASVYAQVAAAVATKVEPVLQRYLSPVVAGDG